MEYVRACALTVDAARSALFDDVDLQEPGADDDLDEFDLDREDDTEDEDLDDEFDLEDDEVVEGITEEDQCVPPQLLCALNPPLTCLLFAGPTPSPAFLESAPPARRRTTRTTRTRPSPPGST